MIFITAAVPIPSICLPQGIPQTNRHICRIWTKKRAFVRRSGPDLCPKHSE